MSEHDLVKKILKALRLAYPDDVWYKIYTGPYQERGVPDILGCHKGRFIGLEVKTPKRKKKEGPTLYQQVQLDRIEKAKGISAVVTSVEEAFYAIRKIKS